MNIHIIRDDQSGDRPPRV